MSNYFTKTIEWNGQLFETEITDTEGYDEYSIIPNGLLIGRRGYILVYSVGSRESFELVPILRDKLFHYSVRAPITFLVMCPLLLCYSYQVTPTMGAEKALGVRRSLTYLSFFLLYFSRAPIKYPW